MVLNHTVPLCAIIGTLRCVREAQHAFACWQRVIVAIWAMNPRLFPIQLGR